MNYTVTTKVNVTEEQVNVLLSCAFEGGSNYWYQQLFPLDDTSTNPIPSERYYENIMKHGFSLTDSIADDKSYKVKPEQFAEALELMALDHPKHFRDLVEDNFDATTGDVFLQLVVFQDVIYG